MRWNQIRLYSITAPLALLPLLDISFSEIGEYVRGMEFRVFMAQVITQVVSGVVDAFILAGVTSLFG